MALRSALSFALVACVFAEVFLHCVACAPPRSAEELAAESAYAAEHMYCVEHYDTPEDISRCRDDVRRRWGIQVTYVRKDAAE